MPFLSFLAKALIPLVHAVTLKLDDMAWKPLESQIGKTICFRITHFPSFYFVIQPQGLVLLDGAPSHIDTIFSGELTHFIDLLFHTYRIQTNTLVIHGDIVCAKALQEAWHTLDLDWQGFASDYLPPEVVYLLAFSLSQPYTWLKAMYAQRTEDLSAYLQEEAALLPAPMEVTTFLDAIDTLRLDVDRLEARVHAFEHQKK